MPIPVTCQCGYQVNAPDQYAGQTAKCPACQGPLPIPAPQPTNSAIADLLDDAGVSKVDFGGSKCPECSEAIAAGGFICINCGFNLQTQQFVSDDARIERKTGLAAKKYTHRSYGNSALDRAAIELEKDEIESKKSTDPTPYWVWLAIAFNFLAFSIGGALTSIRYFALAAENLKTADEIIATFGDPKRKDELNNEKTLDNSFVITFKAEYGSAPGFDANRDESEDTGMSMVPEFEPGTTVLLNQRGGDGDKYAQVTVLLAAGNPGLNGRSAWVRYGSLTRIDRSISEHALEAGKFPRENFDNAWYYGLGNYFSALFWLGIVFYGIAYVTMIGLGFKDDTQFGFLNMIPGYSLVWGIMRWKYVKGEWVMSVIGASMILFGFIGGISIPEILPVMAGGGKT